MFIKAGKLQRTTKVTAFQAQIFRKQ